VSDIPTRPVDLIEARGQGGWNVLRRRGPAAALHALEWPDPLCRTVWVLEVDASALVLGSTQPVESVDVDALAASGVELTRRLSGGGAVLLEPGGSVWVDVFISRDDPRWHDDVGRSFVWLGEAWADALASLGVAGLDVHRGGLVRGRYGRQVCFAGIGPGEVTVQGVKVVGLSQRRTRTGARFQCIVHRAWFPGVLAAIAGVDPDELPPVAVIDRPASAIESALVVHLT
jgi:lipoate-protein ligase A